jgi:hypothetical protein
VFTIIPQARLRYPLWNDRLVPYVFGGVGLGLTGFNDRKPKGFGLQIQDGTKTTVAGTLGLGVEYFVADNIALGAEFSYLFAPDATLMVQGQPEKVKISAPLITFGMRMFYPELVAAPMAEARRDVPARSHGARGRGVDLTPTSPGVRPSPATTPSAARSPHLRPRWANFGATGAELAVTAETNMNVSGLGNIGEAISTRRSRTSVQIMTATASSPICWPASLRPHGNQRPQRPGRISDQRHQRLVGHGVVGGSSTSSPATSPRHGDEVPLSPDTHPDRSSPERNATCPACSSASAARVSSIFPAGSRGPAARTERELADADGGGVGRRRRRRCRRRAAAAAGESREQ